jgi:L-arabinose isomerase
MDTVEDVLQVSHGAFVGIVSIGDLVRRTRDAQDADINLLNESVRGACAHA